MIVSSRSVWATYQYLISKIKNRAGEMAQFGKMFPTRPNNLHRGKGKMNPSGCSLTVICIP